MYRGHLRAATSAWPSTMELRRYRSTFSWMWGQVTQDFHLLIEHLIFPLYLPGTDGKCCEALPWVLTLLWGGWRQWSPLEASGVFFYSKPDVLAHQGIALWCLWLLQAVQWKVVGLESLFWASCVGSQVDLVTFGLWQCWAGLAMIAFIFCSWWFPGVFFTILRNVGCAVKFWGQTSALRFGQVCAGKVEIWVPDSHVCCPQVTAGGTDRWHWRRGIQWRGRAWGSRSPLFVSISMSEDGHNRAPRSQWGVRCGWAARCVT